MNEHCQPHCQPHSNRQLFPVAVRRFANGHWPTPCGVESLETEDDESGRVKNNQEHVSTEVMGSMIRRCHRQGETDEPCQSHRGWRWTQVTAQRLVNGLWTMLCGVSSLHSDNNKYANGERCRLVRSASIHRRANGLFFATTRITAVNAPRPRERRRPDLRSPAARAPRPHRPLQPLAANAVPDPRCSQSASGRTTSCLVTSALLSLFVISPQRPHEQENIKRRCICSIVDQ
jgi:hypothetical protein